MKVKYVIVFLCIGFILFLFNTACEGPLKNEDKIPNEEEYDQSEFNLTFSHIMCRINNEAVDLSNNAWIFFKNSNIVDVTADNGKQSPDRIEIYMSPYEQTLGVNYKNGIKFGTFNSITIKITEQNDERVIGIFYGTCQNDDKEYQITNGKFVMLKDNFDFIN